jgi:hypothetical protein
LFAGETADQVALGIAREQSPEGSLEVLGPGHAATSRGETRCPINSAFPTNRWRRSLGFMGFDEINQYWPLTSNPHPQPLSLRDKGEGSRSSRFVVFSCPRPSHKGEGSHGEAGEGCFGAMSASNEFVKDHQSGVSAKPRREMRVKMRSNPVWDACYNPPSSAAAEELPLLVELCRPCAQGCSTRRRCRMIPARRDAGKRETDHGADA